MNMELKQNELETISISLLQLLRTRPTDAKEIMTLRNRVRDILHNIEVEA